MSLSLLWVIKLKKTEDLICEAWIIMNRVNALKPALYNYSVTTIGKRPILWFLPYDTLLYFISEQPTVIKSYSNGIHYYLIKRSATSRGARIYCGNRFPKGNLAEIDTPEKIKAIRQLYISNFGSGKKRFMNTYTVGSIF